MRGKFRRHYSRGDTVVPIGLWIADFLLIIGVLSVIGAFGLELIPASLTGTPVGATTITGSPSPSAAPTGAVSPSPAGTGAGTPAQTISPVITASSEPSVGQASTQQVLTGTPPGTSADADKPSPVVGSTETPVATSAITGTPPGTSADTDTPSPSVGPTETPATTTAITGTPSPTLPPTDTPPPPALTSTDTPSPTHLPTYTPFPTRTPLPTYTPYLTSTRQPTPTPTITDTPSSTPTLTGTPSPTPTQIPTYTPYPTPTTRPASTPTIGGTRSPTPASTGTRVPTRTPAGGPSPTPFPTYTGFPTYTPYPTPTGRPTYTPFPTPTPAVVVSNEPITAVLDADADVLLGAGGPAKSAEQDWVRGQIRQEFTDYAAQRAGVVLTFGTSPQPAEGNRLAAEVNRLLLEEFPDVFEPAILRNYHAINRDTSQRGIVEVEVYFLIEIP